MQDRFTIQDRQMPYNDPRATQRTTYLENNRLSLITSNHNIAPTLDSVVAQNNTPSAILADNISPQETPLIQNVVRRLLSALQAEGYGNAIATGNTTNIEIARHEVPELNVSSMQYRQNSETSIILGLEVDTKKRTSSFWNKTSSVNRSVRSQPASFTERGNTDININPTAFYLELMFC